MRSSANGEAVVGYTAAGATLDVAETPRNVPESRLIESRGLEEKEARIGDEARDEIGEAANVEDEAGSPRVDERMGSGFTSRMNTPRICRRPARWNSLASAVYSSMSAW